MTLYKSYYLYEADFVLDIWRDGRNYALTYCRGGSSPMRPAEFPYASPEAALAAFLAVLVSDQVEEISADGKSLELPEIPRF